MERPPELYKQNRLIWELKKESMELAIRIEKVRAILKKWHPSEENTARVLLVIQLDAMQEYNSYLAKRIAAYTHAYESQDYTWGVINNE